MDNDYGKMNTLYQACDYLSMLVWKSIHVSRSLVSAWGVELSITVSGCMRPDVLTWLHYSLPPLGIVNFLHLMTCILQGLGQALV